MNDACQRREEIMRPFRMRYRGAFTHESGGSLDLAEAGKGDTGAGQVQQLVNALNRVRVPGWSLAGFSGEIAEPVLPEPEDMTAEEYHRRIDAAINVLREAGVEQPNQVYGLPAGWTRVIERACGGIAARLSLEEDAHVCISQTKEKFGTLRFYVSASGPDDFIDDIHAIAAWAETASENRCCATGRPGEITGQGWLLTLCAEMEALRRDNPAAFRDMVYPPEPAEPSSGDLAAPGA
ncbi:hypothetical protein [Leisingera caerulea]|uniref:hypothetical protein n=1 Tax=Leisingera caerulea TaxID=506591 RepID=UPI000480AE81|nr:hypothetical protein [Leisingera caerulea]